MGKFILVFLWGVVLLLGVHRFNLFLVVGVLGISALLLMRRLIYLTNLGGGNFQHADWLINYSSGTVRRGISGEFFLALGQTLNISPLILVSFVQGLLVLLLIGALFAKALSYRVPDMTVILLLSPALILFWINDTGAAYRKELLGLAAFLPLLFPRTSGSLGIAAVLSLFTVAVFFHEGNIVLAPALSVALFVRLRMRAAVVPISLLWLIALVAALFSMIYVRVPGTEAMCQRVLDAGLSDRICSGIFLWLDDGTDRTISAVRNLVLDRVNLPVVTLLIVLLHLPCLWIARGVLRGPWEWVAFLASTGAIFALYPISTDWSRWLSMQIFVLTFLLLMLAEKRGGFDKPVPKPLYALVLAFSLGFGIDQIAPEPLSGFAYNLFQTIVRIIT